MEVLTLLGLVFIGSALLLAALAFGWINQSWIRPTQLKFSKLISLLLCLSGIFLLLRNTEPEPTQGTDKIKESRTFVKPRAIGWDEVKKEIIKKQCLEQAKVTSEKYPKIAQDYCECSSERIIQEIAYQNYQILLSEPKEKQMEFLAPVLEPCIEVMMKLIKIEEDAAKQNPE